MLVVLEVVLELEDQTARIQFLAQLHQRLAGEVDLILLPQMQQITVVLVALEEEHQTTILVPEQVALATRLILVHRKATTVVMLVEAHLGVLLLAEAALRLRRQMPQEVALALLLLAALARPRQLQAHLSPMLEVAAVAVNQPIQMEI